MVVTQRPQSLLGKFVSESKFRDDPAAFIPHIRSRNREVLEGLITKPEVERKLLLRLRKKAATYAQEFSPDGDAMSNGHVSANAKIDVDGVVRLYENHYFDFWLLVNSGTSMNSMK